MTFLNQTLNQSVTGQPPAITEMDPTIFSVTPTQIIGSVQIPYNATLNLWKINVTTLDGGLTSKPNAFTVSPLPAPSITSVVPSSGASGTTVFFTLNGNYFQPNGGTVVTFSEKNSPFRVEQATLTTVYPNLITGTVDIPAGTVYTGPWLDYRDHP